MPGAAAMASGQRPQGRFHRGLGVAGEERGCAGVLWEEVMLVLQKWWTSARSVGRGAPAQSAGAVQVGEPGARKHLRVALGELLGMEEPVGGDVLQPRRVGVEPVQLPRLAQQTAPPQQVQREGAGGLGDEPAAWDRRGGGAAAPRRSSADRLG